MKIDLVIPLFRQDLLWPFVAQGLAANADAINRVILVNDEPWTAPQQAAFEIIVKSHPAFPPLLLLDHPHSDFGGHRCIRQGAESVETGWWAHIDGDIVLAPGALAKISSEPERGLMLCGLAHDVETIPLDLSAAEASIKRRDPREGMTTATWDTARDLFIFSHRDDYFAMGGHDLSFPGYGNLDYDVAMRWMMHFGPESIEICTTAWSYHIGGLHPHHQSHPTNTTLFKAVSDRFAIWWESQHED